MNAAHAIAPASSFDQSFFSPPIRNSVNQQVNERMSEPADSFTVTLYLTDKTGKLIARSASFTVITTSGLATNAWPSPPVGVHTLTARYLGDTVYGPSISGSITITSVAPPTVSISAPAPGTVFNYPATIAVTAQAAAASPATLIQVSLFVNGAPLGSSPTAPFTLPFANAPPGNYLLSAQATDSLGQVVLSEPVPVLIRVIGLTYFHHDLQGNVVAATDSVGSVLYSESYQPYGARLINDANSKVAQSFGNRLWFHGKAQDEATGLSYFGARYYDPLIGRFLGVDAVGFNEGNIHSFNKYAYGNNNPYRYLDPDGNTPIDIAFLIGDLALLGHAIYKGEGIGEGVVNVGLSVVGVLSPAPFVGQGLKVARGIEHAAEAARGAEHAAEAAKSVKPDFLVSSKGTAMPTNKDFNLVDSKKPGDWLQIHNTHTDAKAPGISHTHFPERHQQSTTREIRTTSGSDIDKADSALRSGQMRERVNRGDTGGPLP